MHTQYDVAKPNDPSGRVFEEMCLAVYSQHFNTRDAMYYNRGHGQHGIDIMLLECQVNGKPRTIVVQCKDIEKLPPSKITPDLREALKHWAPVSQAHADLLIIVATTAKRPNAGKIKSAFHELRGELLSAPMRAKVDILIHGWDDLTSIIHGNAELQDRFRASGQYDPPDEPLRMRSLADSIGRCVTELRLNEARQHLRQARILVGDKPLPATVLHAAVPLLLAAGDFAQLDETLERSLTRRTVSAGALVALFRAKRFTGMVPEHAVHLTDLLPKDAPPSTLENQVEDYSRYLLSAHGALDDTLTLALWMIMHGGADTASRGLLRALSLVRQNWPVECAMPSRQEEWTIRHGRLAPWEIPRASYDQPVTDQEHRAVVLTHAYEFLRALHAKRFAWPSTLYQEAAVGGWAIFYPDSRTVAQADALEYFAFNGACRPEFDAEARFEAAGLANFYAEALRMMADWQVVGVIHNDSAAERMSFGAVCTSQVLLFDVETGHGPRRRKEVTLKVPAIAVERLLAVSRMLEIGDEAECRSSVADSVHAWRRSRLQQLLAAMTRREAEPVPEGRIQVRAVYADYPQEMCRARLLDELRASIMMSNTFCPIVATYLDGDRALAVGRATVKSYWLYKEANPRCEGHRASTWYQSCGSGSWPDSAPEEILSAS